MDRFVISIDAHLNSERELVVSVISEVQNDEMLSAILASISYQCCAKNELYASEILDESSRRITHGPAHW